jgi:hypothetical protein
MQRQGDCSRCGECCGAEGSPNQANPWPVNWFECHRNWQQSHWEAHWSYTALFGIVPGGGGKPTKTLDYGSTRVAGGGPPRNFYWVWVDGRPCKDTSVAHDGSSYSLECPFLMDDPGDGSRPCGLAGTNEDGRFQLTCYPEGPLEFHDQQSVDQWQNDHPSCTHTWIE